MLLQARQQMKLMAVLGIPAEQMSDDSRRDYDVVIEGSHGRPKCEGKVA
jgi:hypothetical protein